MTINNIFLVRHAHSPIISGMDHTRPLSVEGKEAAVKSACYIQQNMSNKPICVCSDATRTLKTAQIIQKKLNIDTLSAHNNLYNSTVGQWHEVIHENHQHPLILVGHNPTMSQLFNQLTNENIHFSPACVGHIQVEIQTDGLIMPAKLISFYNPNT